MSSLLLDHPPNSARKITARHSGLSSQADCNRVRIQRCDAIPQIDLSGLINRKAPQGASDRAGQSQFARTIKEQQYPLARMIAFALLPQTSPFANYQCLSAVDASNALLYLECDFYCGYIRSR